MEKGHLPYLCQSESPYSSPHFHILIKKIEKQFKINWAQIFLNYFTQLFEINFKHWKGHNFLFNKRVSHVCFWLIKKILLQLKIWNVHTLRATTWMQRKNCLLMLFYSKFKDEIQWVVKRGPCMCRAMRYCVQ